MYIHYHVCIVHVYIVHTNYNTLPCTQCTHSIICRCTYTTSVLYSVVCTHCICIEPTFPSLYGGSLEITLSVSLNDKPYSLQFWTFYKNQPLHIGNLCVYAEKKYCDEKEFKLLLNWAYSCKKITWNKSEVAGSVDISLEYWIIATEILKIKVSGCLRSYSPCNHIFTANLLQAEQAFTTF